MVWSIEQRLVRQTAAVAAMASLLSLTAGVTTIAGWLFHQQNLRTWMLGGPPARLVPAVSFFLLGLALWVLRRPPERPGAAWLRIGVKIACGAVLLAALLGLAERLTGWDSGLGPWLANLNPGAILGDSRPGFITFLTALNLSFLSLALLLIDWRTRRGDWLAQVLSGLGGLSALFALLNLFLRSFVQPGDVPPISALNCALLAVGIVCSRPEWALGGLLVSSSAGACWMRRVLPLSLLVLMGFCVLLAKPLLTSTQLDWIEASGLGLVALLLLSGLVVWSSIQINRIEGQGQRVLAALCLKPEQLDRLMEDYEDEPVDSTARHWSKAGIALGVFLTCFGFAFSWHAMRQSAEDEQGVVHTHVVTTAIETSLTDLNEIEAADRGYAATGDLHFFDSLRAARVNLADGLERIAKLTTESKVQRLLNGELRQLIARKLEIVDQIVAERQRSGRVPDPALMLEGRQRMEAVHQMVDTLLAIEAQVLEERQRRAALSRQQVKIVLLISSLLGVAMLVLAGVVTVREINRGSKNRGQIRTANVLLERRVAQRTAELQESEARLRLFVEHAPAALAMFDREMRHLVVSRRWMDDYSLGDQSLRGRTLYEVIPEVPERWKALHQRCIQGEILRCDEDRFDRVDGSVQWVKWEIRPWREAAGQIGGIVIFSEEMTARKKTEEELRLHRARLDAAMASMTDAVFIVDAQGRFQQFNEGFLHYYRFARREDCPDQIIDFGKHFEVYSGEPEILSAVSNWPTFRALKGEIATDDEYIIRRKETGESWVGSYSFAPIRDRQGEIMGAVIVARDITKRKADERELQKLNAELEQRVEQRTAQLQAANQELEAFTYSVSHDLRAPLRHISGYSKLLAEEFGAGLPEAAGHFLTRILEGTHRMGQLIDDLLNLGRVGRQELHVQATGLRTLVDQVIEELQADGAGRQVEWKIGPLPFLDCDPGLIKQVLQNLISNALKFTRTRTPAVIEIGQLTQGGAVTVFVRDNGVGFSMKYAGKLFGVFQRLHRQEDFEGTGVGLATSQRIVQKHGGRVWAEAELDQGATFFFTLTATEEHQEETNSLRGSHE